MTRKNRKQLRGHALKWLTAAAAAAGNFTKEGVLHDIHPDESFKIHDLLVYLKVGDNVLHEVTAFKNRSTGPGPIAGSSDPVEYEGQFMEVVEYVAKAHNFSQHYDPPIEIDEDDSFNVRFDWSTLGGGLQSVCEFTILYTLD